MIEGKYIKNEYLDSELTSKLIRFAYDVYDQLGYGLPEKIYQRSFEKLLQNNSMNYQKEKYGKIFFDNVIVGKYFLDFLVEGIAVEFKVRNDIYQKDINQLLNYMKSEKLKIGIIIALGKTGIRLKRLIN